LQKLLLLSQNYLDAFDQGRFKEDIPPDWNMPIVFQFVSCGRHTTGYSQPMNGRAVEHDVSTISHIHLALKSQDGISAVANKGAAPKKPRVNKAFVESIRPQSDLSCWIGA
jgi:hypothetical protein